MLVLRKEEQVVGRATGDDDKGLLTTMVGCVLVAVRLRGSSWHSTISTEAAISILEKCIIYPLG